MELLQLSDRFWKNVDQNGPIPKYYPERGPCWLWTGALDANGYANRTTVGGDKDYPHRFAYRAFIGPVPEGLEIDHVCCVRNCVNPTHLEAVTHALNQKRISELTTHCKYGHPLSGDNLYLDPRGQRRCRACNARRQQELHAARRAEGLKPPPDARCKWGHPYSVDSKGRWYCKACARKRAREWKARNKQRNQG